MMTFPLPKKLLNTPLELAGLLKIQKATDRRHPILFLSDAGNYAFYCIIVLLVNTDQYHKVIRHVRLQFCYMVIIMWNRVLCLCSSLL